MGASDIQELLLLAELLAANSINQVESAWLVYLGKPTLNLREGVTVVN